MISLALFVTTGLVFSQTFTNTGTFTNTNTITVTNFGNTTGTVDNSSGTMKVKGSLTNATANNFDTQTGTVEYIGTSAAQTILASIKNSAYGNLAGRNGGTKTLGGSLTVSGTVTSDGAGTDVSVGSNTLTVTGVSPIVASSGGTFTASSGTVNYAGDVDQSIFGSSYANLITSGATAARTKSAGGNITLTGTLTNQANTTLDFGANSFTGTGATFANSGTLQSGGVVTMTSGATVGGAFIFNRTTTSQNIPDAQYSSLTLSGGSGATGQKNLSTGTTSVSGTYSVAGANRNYGTGTFRYNGGAQSILNEAYNNLILVGADETVVKTAAAGTISVAGDFTNTAGTLDMAANTLTLNGSGTNTNTGRVKFSGVTNGRPVGSATGTIEYNGTGAPTITLGTYFNLDFSAAGTKSITGGTVAANGAVVINSGAPLSVAGTGGLNVTGNLSNAGTLNNAGTVQVGP